MRVLQLDGDSIIVNEYPMDYIKKIPRLISNGKYSAVYGAFDIETSVLSYLNQLHGIMYVWQFAIGKPNGKLDVYVGRTWKAYIEFLAELKVMLGIGDGKKLLIWCHNLGYEFQWLRSLGEVTRMFAVKRRVPVSVEFDGWVEYRCSYKLSNMSMEKFSEQEHATHYKQSDYDYAKVRYPDDYIDDNDLLYAVCDVLGLHESVASLMLNGGDTLDTLPFTSTGYVRREARNRVQSNPKNRWNFLDTRLSTHEYKLCKSARRGGNVHANYLYTNNILRCVKSKDKSSSYPYQMEAAFFPRGKLIEDGGRDIVKDAANILFVEFTELNLREGQYFPYISISRCERMPNSDYRKCRYDNGRVLYAPLLYMTITDIDFEIIVKQYEIKKIKILEQYVSEYGYLNNEFREYVYEMYRVKCELKDKDEYFYNKFKNKINALFGMLLTDITREDITYICGEWGFELPPVVDALNKYYANSRSFLSYQEGIYVTANARRDLQVALDGLGIDGVYCDTDSAKYIGNHDELFARINQDIRVNLANAGIKPVIIGDNVYELGIWEDDAEYSEFITQGAKKYAYVYSESPINKKHRGELGVTVAGLNKDKGAEYLIAHGGLKAFIIAEGECEGAMFDEINSGRIRAIYNDDIRWDDVVIDGHPCELTSNIALVPTTYTLTHSKDYADLLAMRTMVD